MPQVVFSFQIHWTLCQKMCLDALTIFLIEWWHTITVSWGKLSNHLRQQVKQLHQSIAYWPKHYLLLPGRHVLGQNLSYCFEVVGQNLAYWFEINMSLVKILLLRDQHAFWSDNLLIASRSTRFCSKHWSLYLGRHVFIKTLLVASSLACFWPTLCLFFSGLWRLGSPRMTPR